MKVEIAPSILSADFGKLNEEVAEVEAYADRIHIDVMDGHFVPNISYGAPVYRWLKTSLALDVHLMIEHPWRYIKQFVKAGAEVAGGFAGNTTIIVHAEVCGPMKAGEGVENLRAVLEMIRSEGALAGVSIKPKTSVEDIQTVLDLLDEVLVMTVEPGFGGQEFISEAVTKISELRELGFAGNIGVDGGINAETAKICREAGANVLVAGSYVFGSKDRKMAIDSLR
ncbi:ribulose-phosphate 3-epimerase [Candidatus Peregrinibacteria bacterium]|nr:ribulose-phosphate 3-epimerase [Candidatus Peregrinibacteria bacterium]